MQKLITPLKSDTWQVTRIASLDEVQMDNGGIRYRVQVADLGRRPFLSRWFNDIVPASDFLEKLKGGDNQNHTP
jgi:hypothetical protein